MIHHAARVVIARLDLDQMPRPGLAQQMQRTISRTRINHNELPVLVRLGFQGRQSFSQGPPFIEGAHYDADKWLGHGAIVQKTGRATMLGIPHPGGRGEAFKLMPFPPPKAPEQSE